MDENKFSYKEVFVRYDNVQISVVCSKMVEKVFEYNAHDEKESQKFFPTSQEQLEKVFLILDK